MIVLYFLLWTLLLYCVHRIVHHAPYIKNFHRHHHVYINQTVTQWHWNNLLLFNDDWSSTIDLWITEVIPTVIFSFITDQYWIFIFYYIWAAFFQENLEHNKNINIPLITSGKWHLIHHRDANKNFSLFFPLWDITFGTYKNVDKRKQLV